MDRVRLRERVVRFFAGLDLRRHPAAVSDARFAFVRSSTPPLDIFSEEYALALFAQVNLQDHPIAEQREAVALVHALRYREPPPKAPKRSRFAEEPVAPTPTPAPTPVQDYVDIVGDPSSGGPSLHDAARALESLRPMLRERVESTRRSPSRWSDWYVTLDSYAGREGETRVIWKQMSAPFRGQKLVASDTLDGRGTRISRIIVGNYSIPINMATSHFAAGNLCAGLSLPVCSIGTDIAVEVEFLKDCEWSGLFCGKAAS